MKLKKTTDYSYEVEKEGNMNVPVKVFASDKLIDQIKDDGALNQGINVASLPGIQKNSVMMSDAHYGYGFSIGGVAAFDLDEGIITPGGVGFDINCGVRMLTTNLTKDDVEPKIHDLLDLLFIRVPSGVGSESSIKLTDQQLDEVLKYGARWAVKNGYGTEDDLLHSEEEGSMPGCDPSKISMKSKARGRKQLGTLGAGNHFLEIQIVEEVYNFDVAKAFGIDRPGQIVIMIHTGSRGLGHGVCSEYLRKLEDEYPTLIESLPEKDLIYAPFYSELGQGYYNGMIGSANFAWTNRHIIAHNVRQTFIDIFGDDTKIKTLYDVAHNIAKKETHLINNKQKELIVHRKGATRAFGPSRQEIPDAYKQTGQPVLIPGSMGTSSYVLVGTDKAMEVSFGSTAHGAGRAMGRFKAMKTFDSQKVKEDLEKHHIYVKSASRKGIAEEAPLAYKDVDEVVKVSHDAGIGKLVAKVLPLGVIKG